MPYEEIYFQRLEEDHPKDYEELKRQKNNTIPNCFDL